MSSDLIPQLGRRSYGWEEHDWQHICLAIDTWNESSHDPDAVFWVKEIFDEYGLWDHEAEEPDTKAIRQLYMNRT